METVRKTTRPYGKINKGHTIPYGTLANTSQELRSAYYTHGYQHDEDMPELPRPPQEYEECSEPGEELHKKDVARLIAEVLDDITPRQKAVLCLRFGIGLTQDYTLEEVGVMFDLSRTRIGQIEAKTIRHMKHPLRSEKLRELVGRYRTTAEKKAEIEAKQTRWEKERARAEERREAQARAKVDADLAVTKMVVEADRELRKQWEEIKPMVVNVNWVEHLKTENPEMYQELKYLVGDIWGKNARQVWDMHTTEKK